MADPATKTTPRITRKQAIILAVLGTALAAVLMYNPSTDTNPAADSAATGESPRRRRTPAPTETADWKPNWPIVSLDQMLQQNPFAAIAKSDEEPTPSDTEPLVATTTSEQPPAVPANPSAEAKSKDNTTDAQQRKTDEALAAFQSQKVKLTLRSGNKVTALIGNRLIHEGEVIDGVKIVSILSTGVLVEPLSTEP